KMAENLEEIPLDQLNMTDYKVAREAGTTDVVVDESEGEGRPEITGDGSMREYKEKRNEQLHGPGVQKRIDRLVRQRGELREQVQAAQKELTELRSKYEPPTPQAEERALREAELNRFVDNMTAARERGDWNDLIKNAEDIYVTPSMQAQITSLENGHEVALW